MSRAFFLVVLPTDPSVFIHLLTRIGAFGGVGIIVCG
jgi:hypothetical protein